jgi:hypothetical protein
VLTKAEEIMRAETKPQNPSPLVIHDGQVSDFEVPRSSPIFHNVQRAQRLAAMECCNDQKGQLDKLYAQKGKDRLCCIIQADIQCGYAALGKTWGI